MKNKTEAVTDTEPSDNFSSPDYKRSRAVYMAQCTFEYLLSLLVTDAFLTKLLTHLGLDDTTIGIISSFISLAFVIQIFALFLYKLRANAKTTVLWFYPVSRFIFSSLYIIPFLPIGSTTAKVIVMCLILVAYSCKYLVLNVLYKWANSYVDSHKRASYSATKEMISLASGIIFTAVVGYVFDEFEASGNIEGGFIMIAILAFIISVSDVICILLIKKEDEIVVKQSNKKFKDIMSNTVGNKNFRSVIVFTIIYSCATHMIGGFLGTFKVKDLAMSVFIIQLINIVGNLTRIGVSKPFGRFSDKHSFASGMTVALCVMLAGYSCIIFTTPKTWWLIAAYAILHAISIAGLNQNSFNITYSYVKSDYITEAMAIKSCISGLCGFLASLVGSAILNYIQRNGNVIFGIHVYAQQVLAGISAILILISLAIMIFVIGKQKVMKQ